MAAARHLGIDLLLSSSLQIFLMLSFRELRLVISFSSNLCLMLRFRELRLVISWSNLCLMLSCRELRLVISFLSNVCLMKCKICFFISGIRAVHESLVEDGPSCDKKAHLIATNLTSICCVYKEKIVKDVSYRITSRPYKLRKLQHTT